MSRSDLVLEASCSWPQLICYLTQVATHYATQIIIIIIYLTTILLFLVLGCIIITLINHEFILYINTHNTIGVTERCIRYS